MYLQGIWITLLVGCLLAGRLAAQGVAGAAIQGRVLELDSAVIADATVLATNLSTGERWQTVTASKGRFSFENLSVGGPYRLEAKAIGFVPVRHEGVVLSLGQRLSIDLLLQTTTIQLEPITVTARPDPLANSARTGPAQSFPESTIARLPVPGRDVFQLALLSPQVALSPSGGLSIAGQPDRLNALQIDGASNSLLMGTSNFGGGGIGTALTLPVEAVEELQVLSAPFDVRFGNFAGGLINAVTRSGSNRFTGSVFGYLSGRGLAQGTETQNRNGEFGLTLGGPIVRDRAAFFLDAGIQHIAGPDEGPYIGSDTTGGADSAGVGIRYASVVRLVDILKRTYGVNGGTIDRYRFRLPARNVFGKLTFQLGVNHRLELSHSYAHSDASLTFCNVCLTSAAFRVPGTENATRITWTGGLGPGLGNELMLARSRGVSSCHLATTFPTIFVHADEGDLQAGAQPYCRGASSEQHILEVTDNLTVIAGQHGLTLGMHHEFIRLPDQNALEYFFHNEWHFSSLDSLEQGMPSGYFATVRSPERRSGPLSPLAVNQLGFYLQDRWTPVPRLALTAGLRLDVPFVPRHPVANHILASELGIDNTLTPSGNPLWSPRLGFNWDVTGTGRSFLRGGIGLFAGHPAYKWFNAVYSHTGRDAVDLECTGTDVPAFVTDLNNQPTTCGPATTPRASVVNYFDPAFRFPRNLRIALGADHRLPGGIVGTVDLLYVRGVDQYALIDANLQGPTRVASGEGGRVMYGTVDALGVATPNRRSASFGNVIRVKNGSGDRAISAALQLQRRFSNGVEISGSYTFSAGQDRFSPERDHTDDDLQISPLDGTLENRRLATSDWVVPHKLTLVAAMNLPLDLRLSLLYEGFSGGSYSYVVNGDVNADGFDLNDLVYVPRDAGDITLSDPSKFPALDRLIRAEPCLQKSRGRLTRRNACRNTWVNLTNVRLSKVFRTFREQSVEVIADVFNPLHLLNDDWGVARAYSGGAFFGLVGYDVATGRGIYDVGVDARKKVIDEGLTHWRIQLGAKYVF